MDLTVTNTFKSCHQLQ